MSRQPWGRTGRVVLVDPGNGTPDVEVDGKYVGFVCGPAVHPDGWHAHPRGRPRACHLPTLDAAVMWVLRRTRTDVWAAERRRVVYVRKVRHGPLAGEWLVTVGPGHAGDDDLARVGWCSSHAPALARAIDYTRAMTR